MDFHELPKDCGGVVGEVGQQSKIVYSQYGDSLLQSNLHSQHNTTYKVDRKQVVRKGSEKIDKLNDLEHCAFCIVSFVYLRMHLQVPDPFLKFYGCVMYWLLDFVS